MGVVLVLDGVPCLCQSPGSSVGVEVGGQEASHQSSTQRSKWRRSQKVEDCARTSIQLVETCRLPQYGGSLRVGLRDSDAQIHLKRVRDRDRSIEACRWAAALDRKRRRVAYRAWKSRNAQQALHLSFSPPLQTITLKQSVLKIRTSL